MIVTFLRTIERETHARPNICRFESLKICRSTSLKDTKIVDRGTFQGLCCQMSGKEASITSPYGIHEQPEIRSVSPFLSD